jgi:translation initiation factor IF-2
VGAIAVVAGIRYRHQTTRFLDGAASIVASLRRPSPGQPPVRVQVPAPALAPAPAPPPAAVQPVDEVEVPIGTLEIPIAPARSPARPRSMPARARPAQAPVEAQAPASVPTVAAEPARDDTMDPTERP